MCQLQCREESKGQMEDAGSAFLLRVKQKKKNLFKHVSHHRLFVRFLQRKSRWQEEEWRLVFVRRLTEGWQPNWPGVHQGSSVAL